MTADPPASTYRLQLTGAFGFDRAREVVPYLRALGVGAAYLSPVAAAREGSDHGYDVVDPGRADEARGGRGALERLLDALREAGVDAVLDIVPNHMAVGPENPRWLDLLEHGPASRYARWFDVRWRPSPECEDRAPRLLLPILDAPLGEALEAGALRPEWTARGPAFATPAGALPIEPGSWGPLLDEAADRSGEAELAVLASEARALPDWTEEDERLVEARRRGAALLRERLVALVARSPGARAAIERTLADLAEEPGRSGHPEGLERLLLAQPWRPCDWRVAGRTVAYRRFFDIGHLVGVRVEDPEVFADTHRLSLELVAAGRVTGLRVDHVDGLADPGEYLGRLAEATAREAPGAAPPVWVEKILGEDEALPDGWPCAGTTGYEFANALNAAQVDPDGHGRLAALAAEVAGEAPPFPETEHACKALVARDLFAGELGDLADDLVALAARDRSARRLPPAALADALLALSVALPVYRTYLVAGDDAPRASDRALVETARRRALEAGAGARAERADALRFLGRALLGEAPDDASPECAALRERFVRGWQQLTGPLAAKGVEDTALYRDVRLVSLNEVGAHAAVLDGPHGPERLHAWAREHVEAGAGGLLALSTHDGKRSADVRARIHVLSELAEPYAAAVRRWRAWNAPKRRRTRGGESPDGAEELLLYQTLLGSWPLDEAEVEGYAERVQAYVVKAAREAKRRTSWLEPDEEHEEALRAFVAALVGADASDPFAADFAALRERVAWHGMLNGLAARLVQGAAPGVPDVYQGTELWSLALVDPDNRRPVDYARRRALLGALDAAPAAEAAPELLAGWRDGRLALLVTAAALRLRRADGELLRAGAYEPLPARGRHAASVLAFARRRDDRWAVAVAPRLSTRVCEPEDPPLGDAWADTAVPLPAGAPAAWRDAVSGVEVRARDGALAASEVLARLPVALLVGTSGGGASGGRG